MNEEGERQTESLKRVSHKNLIAFLNLWRVEELLSLHIRCVQASLVELEIK